ncbi:hypothetical protein [Megasphaera cerevisiae]|uniref:hypothetical protein n=1 Tax=Megasphaera cerevisiae TaxID=39029 RepID=UPI0009CC87E6|nr:hypothetical protein [Megasphaera cerevisiae]SJZ60634.1 hypothetical protein SAMN05660900_00934 [Megasphaera cerevisiae DSM 20462]
MEKAVEEKLIDLSCEIISLLGDELNDDTCITIDTDGVSIVKRLNNLKVIQMRNSGK